MTAALAAVSPLRGWCGEEVGQSGEVRNLVRRGGATEKSVGARAVCDFSLLDGGPPVIVDYSGTAKPPVRWLRGELRWLRPGQEVLGLPIFPLGKRRIGPFPFQLTRPGVPAARNTGSGVRRREQGEVIMQGIEDLVEEFDRVLEKRDVQAALEFFADDAEWTLAPGTFSGKDGIRRYLEWDMRTSPKAAYRITGIGVLTVANVAVREAMVEQVWEGISYEYPALTVIEFDDEGKIRRVRSYYDKLGLEQRVAAKAPGMKGWAFRKLINFMVAQGQKGLPDTGREGGTG
jgi:ketosteroid isomerase-like protein